MAGRAEDEKEREGDSLMMKGNQAVSERDLQPGYPLTGCVQSGSNTA